MIIDTIGLMSTILMPINFVCNFIVFLGGFYVALHSRTMSTWATTCLWYIGLASLFTSITIGVDWIWGPEFPMSYTNIGLLGELASLFTLTGTVLILFGKTVFSDFIYRKKRLTRENQPEI